MEWKEIAFVALCESGKHAAGEGTEKKQRMPAKGFLVSGERQSHCSLSDHRRKCTGVDWAQIVSSCKPD